MQDRLAKAIAVLVHAGQQYGKEEFIKHHERVARRAHICLGETGAAVGWLHDALEDGSLNGFPITGSLLRITGVDKFVVETVEILTRKSSETYAAYIKRIIASKNSFAITVKWLDIQDHLWHAETLKPSLKTRYVKAQLALVASLDP